MTLRIIIAAGLTLSATVTTTRCAQEMSATVGLDPEEVLLTGRLVRRTFPGPPNYESVKQGDRAERPILLQLDHPIEAVNPYAHDEDVHDVRAIQVMGEATNDETAERAWDKLIASALGHDVVVKARLRPAETGHHHTALLGELSALKRKGARDFAPVAHMSAKEKAEAEAEELADDEKRLREAKIVDAAASDADMAADFIRFSGTLVERRREGGRRWEWNVKDGKQICWVLQLDHPITLHENGDRPPSGAPMEMQELDVVLSFRSPLGQRDLRALGIVAHDAWDPACQALFGKRYFVTGRLYNNRYERYCAPARIFVNRLEPAP